MSNPFESLKSSSSTPSRTGLNTESAFKKRLQNIKGDYDKATSIFNSSYSNLKASAEAEVKAANDRVNKQQKTQLIIGALTTAATLVPQALSLISSIKACKSAGANNNLTTEQRQAKAKEFDGQVDKAKAQINTYETEISKLYDDIDTASKTEKEQTDVSKAKQKEIDGYVDKKTELTNSRKKEEANQTAGEAEKKAGVSEKEVAEKMPEKVQQGVDENGKPIMVENEARKKALAAAEEKIKAAEEKIKAAKEKIAEYDKQIEEQEAKRKEAVEAKNKADEAVATAKETKEAKTKEVNEKIAARDKLKSEVKQLESAVTDLKGNDNTKQKQEKEKDK